MAASVACLCHYALVGTASLGVHDYYFSLAEHVAAGSAELPVVDATTGMHRVGLFFGVYALWLLAVRLATARASFRARASSSRSPATSHKQTASTNGSHHAPNRFPLVTTRHPTTVVWYEYTWLCNATLVMGAYSLLTERPALALAYGLTVAIDQLLWYVDGVVYLLTKRTWIGVFRHIFRADTQWYQLWTTWHHVWTLPLLAWATWGPQLRYWLFQAWHLSSAVVTLNVLASRLLTPYGVVIQTLEEDNGKSPATSFFHYLNVNLSYEVWKDLAKNIGYLRIEEDRPGVPLYLTRLLTRWMLLNTLIFALAWMLAR
jgi:hypothetical protein